MSLTRFICLLFFLTPFLSKGADTLDLRDISKSFVIENKYLEIFEDTTSEYSIHQLFSKNYLFSPADFNFNRNRKATYWIKFTVKNTATPFSHFVLENYYLHTSAMTLYYKSEDSIYLQKTGGLTTYPNRDYKHKNLIFDIPMPEVGCSRTFIIKINSELYTDFNYRIKSNHFFTYYSVNEYLLLGIFYGMLVIMCLYNFILYVSIRSQIYLLYIFYILSGILMSLNEDKLGFQYLWPESPELNPLLAYYVAPFLLLFSLLLYASEFLKLRKRIKVVYKLVWALFVIYVLGFFLNFYYSIELLLRVFYIMPFVVVFISSILLFYKGYKYSRFFMLGSGLIMTSIILIQVRAEGWLPGTLFTVYILNYSLVAEAILFSLAIADRIKIIQKEKVSAQHEVIKELEENRKLQNTLNQELKEKQLLQEKVNRELEEKVNERTFELKSKTEELEISNYKLQSLIDQANKMNIKLDLDNWELKKNVQHELLQRITGNEVGFDVFTTIFKDDITCLRFLDEVKWVSGYRCKKCGYTKCKEPDNSLIRKCSRCGYPESVTSGTLLHGIKFPVYKALYLVYLIHKRKGKVRLEEISDLSGISVVSASKFKSKIVDKMIALEKKNKFVTWEQIVF